MYWPDYNPRKKKRGSWIGPTILLGLIASALFSVFTGILPGAQFIERWDGAPDAALDHGEAITITEGTNTAVEERTTPTPFRAISAQSENSPMLAPDFILPDLFDESLNRSLSGFSGRPVILNFWASWCVPCKEEMPALQRAYEAYHDDGLVVLGLNQTFVDDLDAARVFVRSLALTFPNARDDTGNTSEENYQVIGLPTSVFITPNGEIAHRQIGQMTNRQIEIFSQQLVSRKSIKP